MFINRYIYNYCRKIQKQSFIILSHMAQYNLFHGNLYAVPLIEEYQISCQLVTVEREIKTFRGREVCRLSTMIILYAFFSMHLMLIN